MAFYKDVPEKNRRKTNYANTGSWDDEGTHYNDHRPSSGRRFGPDHDAEPRRHGGSEGGYRGRDDRRPNREEHRPAREDRRFDEGRREDRRFDRPHREAAPAQRSFRDHEYRENREPERPRRPVEERPMRERPQRPPMAEPVETPENLLTGRNPIREALKSGRDIEKLLVQRGELSGSAREIVKKAKEQHIIVQEVDKSRLDELAPHHQGMIAFASAYQYSTVEAMLAEAEEKQE